MILEKYESTGNDMMLGTIKDFEEASISINQETLGEIARKTCHRHFGVGADHLILVDEPGNDRPEFPGYLKDSNAHCRMIFFNQDGSPAEMSGNGIRCFALFAQSRDFGEKNADGNHVVIVETLAGTRSIELKENIDGSIVGDVNMGQVLFDPTLVPVVADDTLDVPGTLLGKVRRGFAANSGIPHWTLLLDSRDELESHDLEHEGLAARFDDRFPNNTNVDAVIIDSPDHVTARFFERGAHETLSCGTGVTAVSAILHRAGLTNKKLTISVRGGELTAEEQSDKTWVLSGPVRKIARCEFDF